LYTECDVAALVAVVYDSCSTFCDKYYNKIKEIEADTPREIHNNSCGLTEEI